MLLLPSNLFYDYYSHAVRMNYCQEASKFHNKISQYHRNLISIISREKYYKKISLLIPVHNITWRFLSDCTNMMLHNNPVNQLARAQSPTLSPHVSQTEIYVPNIGDWTVAKDANLTPSTKCVAQSIAELCANRSKDSMSIKLIKVIKVLNVQSTLNFVPCSAI